MFSPIDRVCITTNDLKKSIGFYTKLGFHVKFSFTRKGTDFGVYLEVASGNYIKIFEDKNRGTVVNNGICHFCLETGSIDRVIDKLTTAGIPFTPKKTGCDHTHQIWLTDPDGNSFEVHEYTKKSMQVNGGGAVEADW
jgi:catechol 2,3-dioxygenase-like lactoylglutathione lyase family enzyme